MDGSTPALVIFHGPHGYISPTWYEAAPAVPTWNYGVVHAHGLPVTKEEEPFLRGILEELAQRYEGNRTNGWRPESVPAESYGHMLRAIVGFEMPITKLDGKFKLGQNRSAEDRRGVIAALEKEGSRDSRWLAEFMRKWAGV
jgi:transcriptional regulator